MIVNNLMRNLSRNLGRMEKTQQQLASGKQFSKPSDDPIGVSRSLRLNTEISTMDQYKRNADDVKSWLSTTEMAVDNIGEVLKRAKELTVQAASETNNVNERNAIMKEIEELRNQLVQIGNTTYAGSYLFSGYKTDKPLFSENGTYNLGGGTNSLSAEELIEINIGMGDKIGENFVGQRIFGLYTTGDDLSMKTGENLKNKQILTGDYLGMDTAHTFTPTGDFTITYGGLPYTISYTGATYTDIDDLAYDINNAVLGVLGTHVSVSAANNKLVFKGDQQFSITAGTEIGIANSQTSVSRVDTGDKSQLIQVFDQLVTDLGNNNTAGINSALARIEVQFDNLNAIRAEIGVKTNRIELTTNRIEDDTVNLKELMSKNEDADIAEVIMNLKMEEYVYQASLSGGAKIIKPTLVDFIG